MSGDSSSSRALRGLRSQSSPLTFLNELAREGDFVPFSLGRRQAFLLNRPDYVATMLVGEAGRFHKGSANRRAKHLLGEGLLTADAARNAQRRKAIQPAFARRRLDDCAAVIVAKAKILCEEWTAGEDVDVTRSMGCLTFGIVGEAIIGAEVDHLFDEVRAAVDRATASLDPLMSLVAPLHRLNRAREQLHRVAENILSSSERKEGSLLGILGSIADDPDERAQQVDDLLTILLAGHDTLTSALSWTWLLLSAHESQQQHMRDELQSVLNGRDAAAADLPALPYTRAVFAESLRLYPPAWVLARETAEPCRFDDDEVPAGAIVLASQYLLHRDRRYFDRPEVFDPHRWLETDAPPRPKYSYFPFGAGSRSCIGESFAWMEGVLLLATIAQRWRLRATGGWPAIEPRITLRPRSSVVMRCIPA